MNIFSILIQRLLRVNVVLRVKILLFGKVLKKINIRHLIRLRLTLSVVIRLLFTAILGDRRDLVVNVVPVVASGHKRTKTRVTSGR